MTFFESELRSHFNSHKGRGYLALLVIGGTDEDPKSYSVVLAQHKTDLFGLQKRLAGIAIHSKDQRCHQPVILMALDITGQRDFEEQMPKNWHPGTLESPFVFKDRPFFAIPIEPVGTHAIVKRGLTRNPAPPFIRGVVPGSLN